MIDTAHWAGVADVRLQDQQDCDLVDENNLWESTLLDLSWSQIKKLDTSKLLNLIELDIGHTLIKQLILKGVVRLRKLNIQYTDIIKLDLSAQKQLTVFIFDGSKL